MVDLKVTGSLFRRLDEYLGILRELAQTPRRELFADKARLGGARYYLQVAVECCIDVANHIIARHDWRSPRSYADSFAVLAEHQVLPAEFLVTARKMVGMRNRLVHLYWEVDDETVWETLQNNLDDFDRFKAAVYVYLGLSREQNQGKP